MSITRRDGSRDRHDTVDVERADTDEEEQLLRREELEFEDDPPGTLRNTRSGRPGLWNFLKGPNPPRIQTIKPYFPTLDYAPLQLLDRKVPRRDHQIILLAGILIIWTVIFFGFLTTQLPITDAIGKHVLNLDCTDTLWRRKNDCGIDGLDCRPFSNHSFAFRCPAKCETVQILNPHAVGPLDVNYRPLVIGSSIYRGDSFLCAAAIHASVVDSSKGGCGSVKLVGEYDKFEGTKQNGIESIPFDSYFPLSFSVSKDDSFRCRSDHRGSLLLVSIFFTSILSLFSTSPKIFFPIFTLIFAHVSFVSDPPTASYRNITVLPDHISMFAKRLLPSFFVAVIIYRTVIRRTLSGLENQFGKSVLWLGGFWFGALSNYTFDWIPISRLTAHDLEQQPGAKLALAIILIILVLIIAGQIYFFWLEGRLLRYLGLYGLFILGILICLSIPGVNLRIHHYILALLLLPGTSQQTRISLVYQGILLGLFVNGIARWDFDSILQTSDALRGDGKLDSVIPSIMEPLISYTGDGLLATFSWDSYPEGVDGMSVLVNDVERNRAFFDDGLDGIFDGFEWERPVDVELNEYFRFAYVRDGKTLDYSKPGTLFANGTWAKDGDG